MDAFEAVRNRDMAGLILALRDGPGAARTSNADGASLLSFARYMGSDEAVTFIRTKLSELTPYEAILVGDAAAVRKALDAGWDSNALSPDGFSALALAAFFKRKDLFDLLLPLTRDVNVRSRNAQQVAALHAATASRAAGAVEKLLRAGADPNLPQQDGVRPIHVSAQHGDATITGLLLLFGASATLRSDQGQSAIEHARTAGHEWLAERLAAFAAAEVDEQLPQR